MKLLENKVAVITGAARGIGEGIALKFAEHGANIAFTYVSESSAGKAKDLEEKLGSKPTVGMICLGGIKQHKARLDFMKGFLAAGGWEG